MSIASAMQSLLWTLFLLFVILYVSGVFLVIAIGEHYREGGVGGKVIEHFFGSLVETMVTLFQAVTGGVDWETLWSALMDISPEASVFLLLYIFGVSFCILNMITGVFVDQAAKSAEEDLNHVIQEQNNKREAVARHLKELFHEADTSGDGKITWSELREHLGNQYVRDYFKTLDIEEWDLRTFF